MFLNPQAIVLKFPSVTSTSYLRWLIMEVKERLAGLNSLKFWKTFLNTLLIKIKGRKW
jgi:hypothetical protein